MNILRFRLLKLYKLILSNRTRNNNIESIKKCIVVFAPHPDDETLGCGGTILKQIRAGSQVKIVFMTDGANSHSHIISSEKLGLIRAQEAIAAGKKLEVSESNLIFLGYRDSDLCRDINDAVKKVQLILKESQPDEIFIPHEKEPITNDHFATHRIVSLALKNYKKRVIVSEYPVWLYYHFPWVQFQAKDALGCLKHMFFSSFHLIVDFRFSVYVGDVISLKRLALQEHRSQITRLFPHPRWQTLGDLSNGEFLECFFQDYELFNRYVLNK
ncbi:MAG: PIG-L family deacetylase [Candidatus Bathyarchaeota archaeon]|nr:PIG-L family deacetylase [Candidatus Bathyarchaeota archaeon]